MGWQSLLHGKMNLYIGQDHWFNTFSEQMLRSVYCTVHARHGRERYFEVKAIVKSIIFPSKLSRQFSSQLCDQKISSRQLSSQFFFPKTVSRQLSSQLCYQINSSRQLSSQLFGETLFNFVCQLLLFLG